MYLVSVIEDQAVIEASLGGRIDQLEMKIFAEEIEDVIADMEGESFYLLLDYSKAIPFDSTATVVLDDIKEMAIATGAAKVYSVPQEGTELSDHVASRMQAVLEGKEEFLNFAHEAKFAPLTVQHIALAA
jgi:hypothetical protein